MIILWKNIFITEFTVFKTLHTIGTPVLDVDQTVNCFLTDLTHKYTQILTDLNDFNKCKQLLHPSSTTVCFYFLFFYPPKQPKQLKPLRL